VKVYCNAILFWQGQVDDRECTWDKDGGGLKIKAYGPWIYALRCTAQQRFFYDGLGSDLSLFFPDFITRWILPHHPELVVYSDPIGILKTGEDAFGKNAKQTLSKAREWSANTVVYGGDYVSEIVDMNYGRPRLFLRKVADVAAPALKLPIPSARVGPVSIQKRASQVANAVWIQGGERQFPNVYPSDMEDAHREGDHRGQPRL